MQRKKRETRRGNERILIRNLKNKIIRLPDSKCQLRNGSRWRKRQTHRKRVERKRGEKKHPEGDRWGWSEPPSLLPPGRKEYNLSDAKEQHIARKDIPCLPLEGNRGARSAG